MMEFTAGSDPDGEIVARLKVVCPRHPDQLLATYCLTNQGVELIETTPGFSSESIAGTELEPGSSGAMLFPSDGHDPEGVAHFRHRFRCPRPSCSYDAQRRTDGETGMHALTSAFLVGMRSMGRREVVISNVDGTWHVMT